MNNNKFYKIGAIAGVVFIGIIIAGITIVRKNNNKIAEIENSSSVSSSTNVTENGNIVSTNELQEISDIDNNEKNTTKTSENNANSVNQSSKNNVQTNQTSSKNNVTEADNITKSQKANDSKSTEKNKTTETKATDKKQNAEPVFKKPVSGEIITEYAKDKLVFSNTLGEWITHQGIDIKAKKTTVVKSTADGTVKSIKNDPRYGLSVVVEHSNGYSSVYSNLLTAEFVKEGEKIKSGQSIGTVGNTASFEILDESHLHFEILKNGEQIDPSVLIK